jgi:hypothetical protein
MIKSTILLTFFLLLVLQISCLKQSGNLSNTNALKDPPVNSSVITSDTAILIAKGYLCFDYDLINYDVSVTDKEDIWEVRFSSKRQDSYGYGPVVLISKINGEPKGGIHGK